MMPARYFPAILWLLCFFGLIIWAISPDTPYSQSIPQHPQKNENERKQAQNTNQQKDSSADSLVRFTVEFGKNDAHQTDWSKPNCAHPKNHDEADLCQQIGMGHTVYYTFALGIAQTFLGVITFISLIASVIYAGRAANAARDSADAAKQTFMVGHRAWLRVDVAIGSHGTDIDENGVRMDIRYRIENIGNALATNVTPHIWLVPFNGGAVHFKDLMGEEGNLPIQIQRKRCNEIRRKPFDLMGFLLFPNEVWPDVTGIGEAQYGISLDKREIRRILGGTGAQGVGLFIIGCVDYTFPSDSANHHQTWFSYSLTKEMKTYRTDDSIIVTTTFFQESDGNIPKDDLMLFPDPFGMGRHAD